MEHHEAIETMASERYLLDELTPEVRDAYEEHMFGCTECANDVRFGATFVDHARAVLPGMADAPVVARQPVKDALKRRDRTAWLRPAFAVPAFACLLVACLSVVVGYQNLVVYPELRASASEPRLLPPATVLHGETRSTLPVVYADLVTGTTLSVPLPQSNGQSPNYASYRFDFYDSTDKAIWTRSVPSAESSDDMATIWLPGRVKEDSYRLTVTGVMLDGCSVPLQQQFFQLRVRR